MKDKKAFYLRIFPALFAGYLIAIFLSGKIIYIPKGTHQGGVISATGVLIIIFMSVLVNIFILKIFTKNH